MTKKPLLLIFLLITLISCSTPFSQLEQALQLAGDNRSELETVLKLYSETPSDSLKYKAAVFLIENMVFYHSYEGKLLDNYLHIYESIATSGEKPQDILNSFVSKYGYFSTNSLTRKPDIREVNASYLINNIEWAFKVWEEQPWGRNVSFDDFCEYILPYRIEDEKLTEWRQGMFKRYNHLLDPFRGTKELLDPLFAAKTVFDSLSIGEKHFTTFLPDMPHIGPELCERWRAGSCRELTDLTVYVFRALGIPCGVDFMPVHARGDAGHLWTFILDINGDTYTSDYLDPDIGIISAQDVHHFTSKIYRKTFSPNKQMIKELPVSVPPLFYRPKLKDVTHHYPNKNPIRSITIPRHAVYEDSQGDSEYNYLCVFSGMDWIPVAWTKAQGKNGTIQFDNVKSNIVFRVGTWKNNQMKYKTDVIKVCGMNGKIEVLALNEDKQETVILLSKCDADTNEEFAQFMVGGVFEGSNHANFANSDTLFTIKKKPLRLENVVYPDTVKQYRYVRYCGAEKSHCDVSEITFYKDRDGQVQLNGKIMGTPNNLPNNRNDYTNVFDGDSYTSFHYKEETGGWIGLDLGKPQTVSRIVYIPRNRDNFIRRGDDYELLYFNRSWFSLGRKTANADSIIYENVPSNTLLYLKNHTRGKLERIFVYENNEQVWW